MSAYRTTELGTNPKPRVSDEKVAKSISFCNHSCNFGLQKRSKNHEKRPRIMVYTVITDHDVDHTTSSSVGCTTWVAKPA